MSVDNKFLVRDKITLKVTGLGSSGEGVGKTDGFTAFAHGALADETVEVELEQVKKKENRAAGIIGMVCTAASLAVFGPDNFLIPAMILLLTVLLGGRKRLCK